MYVFSMWVHTCTQTLGVQSPLFLAGELVIYLLYGGKRLFPFSLFCAYSVRLKVTVSHLGELTLSVSVKWRCFFIFSKR